MSKPKRKRTSIVWQYSVEELQAIIDTSLTITDVCAKLSINSRNGAVKTLLERIRIDKLSTSKLKENRLASNKITNTNHAIAHYLTENSSVSRNAIKKHILRAELIEYKCVICLNTGEWMGNSISLHLDHINGVNNDNRIDNLRFLCPNCHSQTPTYAGKNGKAKSAPTPKPKIKKPRPRKFHVTEQQLIEHINARIPFTTIGKMYGVSDNAIRRRCHLLGVQF